MSRSVPIHRRRPGHVSAIAFGMLAIFSLQLCRSFLVIPLDGAICLVARSERVDNDHFNHHHDGVAAGAGESDDGTYLHHCKDTETGVLVSFTQPFGIESAAVVDPPQESSVVAVTYTPALPQATVPPPFQPPRA
jgi:hypothetical protein